MAQIKTIEFEVIDTSALSMAHAIGRYYIKNNDIKENALIDLQEVAEHIEAYVRAEYKAIEARRAADDKGISN